MGRYGPGLQQFVLLILLILGHSKALRLGVPMNLASVQIPSTLPCLPYRHPAVLAQIFVPTGLCGTVASFLEGGPTRHAGHPECVQIGVCKQIIEHNKRDISGPSTGPIVSDLVLRNRGLGQL